MKDAIVTVVAGIVLAFLFMYVLLSVVFSGWGDRSLKAAYIRNELETPVVVFLCDQQLAAADCRGVGLAPRSTDYANVESIGHNPGSFAGDVVVTNEQCEVMFRAQATMDGDFAVVVTAEGVQARGDISPYGERHAPGFSQAPGSAHGNISCPNLGYG